MAVGDAYVFLGFLTPVLTQLFFPKPPTTFLTCFCRGERRKYAGKKSHLNRGSNSQPPGHESNTLTTELPGRGTVWKEYCVDSWRKELKESMNRCTGHRDLTGIIKAALITRQSINQYQGDSLSPFSPERNAYLH